LAHWDAGMGDFEEGLVVEEEVVGIDGAGEFDF
jgi:hypothetical protein